MKQSDLFRESAENCMQLAERADDMPTVRRFSCMARAWSALAREHGEAGEHRTFPEVSTVAHSSPVGGSHLPTSAPQAQRLRR